MPETFYHILAITAFTLTIAACVFSWLDIKPFRFLRREPEKPHQLDMDSATAAKSLLEMARLGYKEHPSETSTALEFDFQGFPFTLRTLNEGRAGYIYLGNAFSVNAKDLNMARSAINCFNRGSHNGIYAYYYYDCKNDIVMATLKSDLPLWGDADLALHMLMDRLQEFCQSQKSINSLLEDFEKTEKANGTNDPENKFTELKRLDFLMSKQENDLQHTSQESEMASETFTIGSLLRVVYGWENIVYSRLEVITGQGVSDIATESIEGFDFIKAYETSGKGSENALTLRLGIKGFDKSATEPYSLLLAMTDLPDTGTTTCMRMDIAVFPGKRRRDNGESHLAHEVKNVSLLLPVGKVSAEKKKAEADYVAREVQDKMALGLEKEFSEAELSTVGIDDETMAYHLYWGTTYTRQERYYEAILHLDHAWKRMNAGAQGLSGAQFQAFTHASLLLGLCLTALGQYERAYYYLDITIAQGDTGCTKAYLNCLTAANDFRALPYADHVIDSLNHAKAEQASISEDMEDLLNFARRRKVFICTERQKYNEAEKVLIDMLDEAANFNFALSELAYIQRCRKSLKIKSGDKSRPQ